MEPQTKLFIGALSAATALELLGEVAIYGVIPPTAKRGVRQRFWTQYGIGLSIIAALGSMGAAKTQVLARKPQTAKIAWILSLLPFITILTGGAILHGVSTVIGVNTGTNSYGLIKCAVAKNRKSLVVERHKTPNPIKL